jgi:hypothetical protein
MAFTTCKNKENSLTKSHVLNDKDAKQYNKTQKTELDGLLQ